MVMTLQALVSQVMPLLFNTLSRFVIALLPRSKCLLISWLWSRPIVILEPKKIKSATAHCDFGAQENKICHCFHFSSIYLP